MSDNAVVIVDPDASMTEATERAAQIAAWLLAENIVVRRQTTEPNLDSEFVPGPSAGAVAPGDARFLTLAYNGVEVIATRQVHLPMGNYEPPPCPACGTPLNEDMHLTLVEEWFEGCEPTVTCLACGVPNLLGDWVSPFTIYVGNLAVSFANWPPLTETFTNDLGAKVGLSWRVIFAHL